MTAPAPAALAAPDARKRRSRKVVAIALVVALVVAAAIAVPLALTSRSKPAAGGGGSTSPSAGIGSLPAARVLAKAIAAATDAGSYQALSDEGSGTQVTTVVAANGVGFGTSSSALSAMEIGATAYFTSASVLESMGVTQGEATTAGSGWYADPRSGPGVAVMFAGLTGFLSLLHITHPAKELATATEVELTGTSTTGGAVVTVTISTASPYYPEEVRETVQGETEGVTFSRWGAVPALTVPSSTPITTILHPTGQQDVLAKISLGQRDLPKGVSAVVLNGGLEVAGQTTLDFCSDSYASETLRVDRRQMVTLQSNGTVFTFSTEAVIYKDAAATLTAFAEVRAAAANCQGGSDTTVGGSWPTVPGVERLSYATSESGFSSDVVYLRRGRVLLGIYFNGSPTSLPFAVAGSTSIETITHTFEQRLAALPASAVG
ncbi:MAG: hypothetical protein ACRD0Z_10370 [Acidimicrobiales bacterium]